MGNKDKLFKGQQDNESVICFFRKHWITLIVSFLTFAVVLLFAVLFLLFYEKIGVFDVKSSFFRFVVWFGLVFFGYSIHKFFLDLFNHYLTICIITDYRIVALTKTVYLRDIREAVDLGMIQDVSKRQNGLFPNFLHFGDIIISLSSAAATMVLMCAPNPDYQFRVIQRAKQTYLQARILAKQRAHGGFTDYLLQSQPQDGAQQHVAELENIPEKKGS